MKISKIISVVAISVVVLSATSAANASSNDFYVSGGIGYSSFKNKINVSGANITSSKSSPSVMVGVGTNITNDIRADLNITYNQYKSKNYKNHVTTILLNGYMDVVKLSCDSSAYATIGAGISNFKTKNNILKFSSSKNRFAWQLGAGLTGKMTETTNWDIVYRFTDIKRKDLAYGTEKIKVRNYAHSLMAGLRVNL